MAALASALLAAGGLACTATSQQKEVDPADPDGASGATAILGSEGSGGDGVDLSLPDTPPDWPADLPSPWQYADGQAPAYKAPELPEHVEDLFTGETTTEDAPKIVYPLNNSMHPNNLLDVSLQWDAGRSGLARVDIVAADAQAYHLYLACSAEACVSKIPKSEWYALGSSYAGQELTITVNGTDGVGGPVRVSDPIKVHFSPENLVGALYYWSSASEELKRATFGSEKAVPFISPRSPTNEYACVACHSVSRDGKVLAFAVSELGGENGAGIQVAPTENPAEPYLRPTRGTSPWSPAIDPVIEPNQGFAEIGPTDNFGSSVALNSDGTLAAINGSEGLWPVYFEIRDARSGDTLERHYPANDANAFFGAGNLPIFPEWSPDGKSIAVTLAWHNDFDLNGPCFWYNSTCAGSIAVLPVGDNGLISGPPRVLVAHEFATTGINHFYPTWSPDGQYIAFVSGPANSFNNDRGVIRIVRAEGGPYTCPGPGCWELANGTGYGSVTASTVLGHSTWPKFTPFAQGENKELFFISFTTRLPYGFLTPTPTSQLWMFAVDSSKLGAGQDASFAPIWLPYQELTEQSLTPYWTETLPCQVDEQGACSGCVANERCQVSTDDTCRCVSEPVK